MSSFVKASGGLTPNSADPGEEFPFLHTITVVDRVVSVDKPELVQNNIKTETVTLNLDSEWDGLSTVINIGNKKPVPVIWSGEPVVIPAELMTTVGSLDVSVVGYGDDGGIRAVTKQAKSIFNVVASGFVEGDEAVPDPTTVLGQLVQAADRFNQASEDIGGIGPAIEKVQASEANAKHSETNAASSAESASQSASTASTSAEAARTSETNAAASATTASQSASQAQSSATAAASSAQAASTSAESARTASDSATSSKDAAAQSASQASASASAAQQAVDGFGLKAGTTTTSNPGSDAAVNITKQGTKYVADFTIPRGPQGPKGDPGDLTAVSHNATLTGDGTANNVLRISKGFYPDAIDIDPASKLNDLIDNGLYRISGYTEDDSPISHLPIGGFVVVNHVGSSLFQSLTVVWKTFDTAEIYIRSKVGTGPWLNWKKIAFTDDLSSYVPLSTYAALEARVRALEAKSANQ